MTTHPSLHPELIGLVEALHAAPPITELPPPVLRQLIREQWFDANAPADIEIRNIPIPAEGRTIPARLYIPSDTAAASPGGGSPSPGPNASTREGRSPLSSAGPGVVFLHGGGFIFGDLDSHDGACRRLCRASGVRILAIDYRLAPEHRMPAAHDDAEAAVRWAFAHAAQLGFDPERIGLCGDSAGGLLAASTAFVLRSDPGCRIKAQVLIYPVLLSSGSTPSRQQFAGGPILDATLLEYFSSAYFGSGTRDDARVNLLDADLTGMPAATLVISRLDPLQDEGRTFASRLTACGVPTSVMEVPDLPHGFLTLSHVSPAVEGVVAQIGATLAATL